MTTNLEAWLDLRSKLEEWGAEWDAGVVQIRLSDGRRMYLDDAVPDTRADCPTEKPCPHVRCRYHLWRVDACDRAGRPGLSSVPRNEQGLTLSVPGKLDGGTAGTTVEARWLETPVPPSCALDEVDRHKRPMTNAELAGAYARHRTLGARDVRGALEHAQEVAAEMGMSGEDLKRGLGLLSWHEV